MNNPWFFTVYKDEVVPIPIRLWSAPNVPENIEGYTFKARGKIALEADVAFEVDDFTIEDVTTGLAYFVLPSDVLSELEEGQYLTQITITKKDGTIRKSNIFTLRIVESI